MEHRTLIKGGSFLYSASGAPGIFTPEQFTEEHRLIAATASRFLEEEVLAAGDEMEGQNFDLVRQLMQKAGEIGLLAHSVPEQYGGLGMDKITKGLVGETIGAGGAYSVAHSNHTCIATLPITYFGTDAQKQRYLPKLASGEWLGAYCLTEPEAGSDALSARTTAVLNESGTHYVLNGTKTFITNAEFADTFIVYAKVDGKQFTAFIVERAFPGLSLGPEEQKMGIKGSSTRPVVFEDCEVPIGNLLGEIGKGHHIALNVLNLGRFNLGSACMGAAKHALKTALSYTQERRQFGRTIADFPLTKEKVAGMAQRLYALESLQYRTAGLLETALGNLDEPGNEGLAARRLMEYAVECAICKVYGSETLDRVVDEALQLHGGYGFIKEYGIERMYRDSRINRIFEGTNEINRLIIPGNLLKQTAKGEVALEELITEAMLEMQSPEIASIGIISREIEAVRAMRRVFLLAAGFAAEVHGKNLGDEQEMLMKLADLAISLYAAESAVLRTSQAIEAHGEESAELKIRLTKSFIDDALLQVEMTARRLVQTADYSTRMADAVSLITEELGRLQGGGFAETKRSIAERMLEAGRYTN